MLVVDILDNYDVNVTNDIGVADDITEQDVCHGNEFSFSQLSIIDIHNELKRINVEKATGCDMIPPMLTKHLMQPITLSGKLVN